MHITTFEAKDFEKRRNDGIIIIVNYRRLVISAKLVRKIGLTVNDRILIHQDRHEPHVWYMSINEKGFSLRANSKSDGMCICCTEFSSMILQAFGLIGKTDSITFHLEEEPIIDDNVRFWKLKPQTF